MNSSNKRKINLRPTFMIFLGLMSGIGMMSIFFVFGFSVTTTILFTFLMGIVILFVSVVLARLILKSSFTKSYASHMFLYLLAFTLMLGYGYIVFNQIKKSPEYQTSVIIIGEISNDTNESPNQTLLLKDVLVIDRNGGVTELGYHVEMYMYDTTKVYSIGSKCAFEGYLTKYPIKEKFSKWVDGIGYQAKATLISTYDTSLSWSQSFKLQIKDLLLNHMNEDLAGLCYGSLFGDKGLIESGTKDNFSNSGLAHMLAVSGLHIGFFVAILTFILKKFKTPKYLNLGVISFFLLVYCHLCGYSPSCIRASIMSLVMLFGYILGAQYDSLSSLGFSGVIILLVSPLQLFDIGFQLSYLCVFSILTLNPCISAFFKKIRFPEKLAQSLSITCAVNIGLLPAMIGYFKQVSFLNLFANLFAIPLFGIGYVSLFFAIFVAMLIPFFSFVLWIPKVIFHGIRFLAQFFSHIPYSYTIVHSISIYTIFALTILMIILKYVMCKPKWKYTCSFACLLIIIISLVITNQPSKVMQSTLYFIPDSTSLVLEDEVSKERYIIGFGDVYENLGLQDFLEEKKMYQVKGVLPYELTYSMAKNLEEYEELYNIESVYIAREEEKIFSQNATIISTLNIGEIVVKPYFNEKIVIGYEIISPQKQILVLNKVTKSWWQNFTNYEQYDMIYIESLSFDLENATSYPQIIVKETTKDRVEGIKYLTLQVYTVEV